MLRSAIILIVILSATLVFAQDASTGAVRGTVRDASSSTIENATLVLVNTATGLRYSAITDSEGRFAFELLPPAPYSARAEAAGMSPQTTPELNVELGASLELNFTLAVAGAKETITVSDAPPRVETQPSPLSSSSNPKALNHL